MNTQGWIWMIGLRVIDVGLLVVWLIWFFRLRDDDDAPDDDSGGGGGGPRRGPMGGPGGGGLGRPADILKRPARYRLRGPSPLRGRDRGRGAEPIPRPQPARVRRPLAPVPARRAMARRTVRRSSRRAA